MSQKNSELLVARRSHHRVPRVLKVIPRVLDPSLGEAVPHPPVVHVPRLEQGDVGVASVVIAPRHQHQGGAIVHVRPAHDQHVEYVVTVTPHVEGAGSPPFRHQVRVYHRAQQVARPHEQLHPEHVHNRGGHDAPGEKRLVENGKHPAAAQEAEQRRPQGGVSRRLEPIQKRHEQRPGPHHHRGAQVDPTPRGHAHERVVHHGEEARDDQTRDADVI
mmetsp:Transcript_6709/g.29560  ORF Transcript_6709/g.29560 Transcript_6709/m.29560 type:complete len:217 (+) Transcript_6709:123-773(+)